MQTSSSSLLLEGYHVTEFHFSLRTNPNEKSLVMALGLHIQSPELIVPGPLEVSVDVSGAQETTDSSRWRFDVRIYSNEKTAQDYPYDFDITMVGFFEVSSDIPPDVAKLMVRINGPSLLYSAAREYIAAATARSPFPALILPTLRFLPDPEGKEETADQEQILADDKQLVTKTKKRRRTDKASKSEAKKGTRKKSAKK